MFDALPQNQEAPFDIIDSQLDGASSWYVNIVKLGKARRRTFEKKGKRTIVFARRRLRHLREWMTRERAACGCLVGCCDG